MMARAAKKIPRPAGAFAGPGKHPTGAALQAALGPAHAVIGELFAALQANHPDLAWEWKHANGPGWHRICVSHERRVFYLVPETGGFRLSLIVGDRALAAAASGHAAVAVKRLLKSATRYPEGTAFRFTAADFDPAAALALLKAKLAR